MNKSNKIIKIFFNLLTFLLLIGCNNNVEVSSEISLNWAISEERTTLYPEAFPTVSSYKVELYQDDVLIRTNQDITENSFTIRDLATGSYKVVITGLSEGGAFILQGSKDTELDLDGVNETITLRYFFDDATNGSLSVNSNWLKSGFIIDDVDISLLDSSGLVSYSSEVTITDYSSFSVTMTDLPPDIYTMDIDYIRNGEVVSVPTLYSVVITPDTETSCDLELNQNSFNPYWSSQYAGFDRLVASGDGYPAISSRLDGPIQTCFDSEGNFYIADYNHHRIRMVDTNGIITNVAGIPGSYGYSGDGGGATAAKLSNPQGIAVDSLGNIYIADTGNKRVRKVDVNGRIWTIAGNGEYTGSEDINDGALAVQAQLNHPIRLTLDGDDILYITDCYDHRIRKLDLTTGIISTVAGNGDSNSWVSGEIATGTSVRYPMGIVPYGDEFYIASLQYGLAKIDSAGILTPLYDPGDNVRGITIDNDGNIFIPEGHRVVKYNSLGEISIISGSSRGYFGNGSLATEAFLDDPHDVTIGPDGLLYISDFDNDVIRRIGSDGIINNVVGTYNFYVGYDKPAVDADLSGVDAIAEDSAGNKYIVDNNIDQIRKIDTDGIITLFAGTGVQGYTGDGGPAIYAEFNQPLALAFDSSDNLYIVDRGNNVIRKIDTDGIVTTFAGLGTQGYYGDGIPASSAIFNYPYGIFCDTADSLYISDTGNNVIRKIDTDGIITTVAGYGEMGDEGDGGLAIDAKLNAPQDVFVDDQFNIYIADTGNNRIRYVDIETGIISTVAGTGTAGNSGDESFATASMLNHPVDVFVDQYDQILIADHNNNRVRRVSPSGVINSLYFIGDSVNLSRPPFVFVDSLGILYSASESYDRIYTFEYYNDKF